MWICVVHDFLEGGGEWWGEIGLGGRGGDQPNYTWLIQSNRSGPKWIEGLELILI